MPALNFQKQFAGAVESGQKRQTIRAYREDGRNPRPGETLYLYVGQRTKGCRKLGEAKCIAVESITIRTHSTIVLGQYLSVEEEEREAKADGFTSFAEMRDWFEREHGLPFSGLRIRWAAVKA